MVDLRAVRGHRRDHRGQGRMKMAGVENRRHRRYSLALPLKVRVKMQDWTEAETSTRDLAAAGVYFSLAQPCEIGSAVEFDLTLPPEVSQGNPVRIRCRGKVVRVERPDDSGKIGIGATIEEYDFVKDV